MKKYVLFLALVLSISLVYAHGEEDFSAAESLIRDKTPCSELSEDQLELIGDYYMEQMHPGELHEAMDQMMGGEESQSLRQMHISMARSFYCADHDAMPQNMMSMMMGRQGMQGQMMGPGMMNSGYGGSAGYNWLLYVILGVLIGLLVSWWIKGSNKKRR